MQTDFRTHALIITLAGTGILATALMSEIWGGLTLRAVPPTTLAVLHRPAADGTYLVGAHRADCLTGAAGARGSYFRAWCGFGLYHAGWNTGFGPGRPAAAAGRSDLKPQPIC